MIENQQKDFLGQAVPVFLASLPRNGMTTFVRELVLLGSCCKSLCNRQPFFQEMIGKRQIMH